MKTNKRSKHKTKKGKVCILAAFILIFICGLALWIYRIGLEGNKSVILSAFAFSNSDNKNGAEGKSIDIEASITPNAIMAAAPSAVPSPSASTEASDQNKEETKQSSITGIKDYNENDVKLNPIDKNYTNFFKNDLFIGDSITDELYTDDLVDDKNVCSKLGLSLLKAKAQIDTAKISNPRNIYILLGLNDLTENTLSSETFISQYTDIINYIKNKYPSSKIYVQSILPVTAAATEKAPCINNQRIGEFNTALSNMTANENISYMDLTSLVDITNYQSFESDGEHPNYKFHPVWLNYIENNIKTN